MYNVRQHPCNHALRRGWALPLSRRERGANERSEVSGVCTVAGVNPLSFPLGIKGEDCGRHAGGSDYPEGTGIAPL